MTQMAQTNTDAGELSLTSVVRLAVGYRFQWEPVQESHVLLYPEGMVQLNETASAILTYFATEPATVGTVIEKLQQEFNETDLKADVLEFLAEAFERGWIKIG